MLQQAGYATCAIGKLGQIAAEDDVEAAGRDLPPLNDAHFVQDMVAYLDKQMGRLTADLERLGLRDNTIVIFTSDNGPQGAPLGTIRGKPMVGGKGDVTEGGVRTPFLVNCPGLVPQGRVCGDLTDFTDVLPTVLELAGVKPSEDLEVDGRSIAPQILGRQGRPREWVYAQHGRDSFIANDRYKLYGDGRFVDIGDSPVSEIPIPAPHEDAAKARDRLAAAMKSLLAGAGAVPPRDDAGGSGQ